MISAPVQVRRFQLFETGRSTAFFLSGEAPCSNFFVVVVTEFA